MSTNVDVAFDADILFTLLTVASIGSMYLAGQIAERRGRRFTMGVDRRIHRTAGASIDIPVSELASQERPRLI